MVILLVRGALWQPPDIVHHLICLLNLSICLSQQTFLFHTMWAFLGELSTPFVNLRYMFEKVLRRPVPLVDYLFAVSFMATRPVSLTIMLLHCFSFYSIWHSSFTAHIQFAIGVFFAILNYYWASIIIRTALNIFFPASHLQQKKPNKK